MEKTFYWLLFGTALSTVSLVRLADSIQREMCEQYCSNLYSGTGTVGLRLLTMFAGSNSLFLLFAKVLVGPGQNLPLGARLILRNQCSWQENKMDFR